MVDDELEIQEGGAVAVDEGYGDEHANGRDKGPDPMYFAEAVDREMTDVQQDPAALFREMLGPGDHPFDLFMRTRWQSEDQLNRAVNVFTKNYNWLKTSPLFKNHELVGMPADLFGMSLKMYGLIGLFGDGRYEFLQANAGVVVAERRKEGQYKKRDAPTGREQG